MSILSDIDKRYLEFILEMNGGYILDYNDATFGEFFRRHCVNIHGTKYCTLALPKRTIRGHFLNAGTRCNRRTCTTSGDAEFL